VAQWLRMGRPTCDHGWFPAGLDTGFNPSHSFTSNADPSPGGLPDHHVARLGYLLLTTALVPVIGRLADMFGRRKLYDAGFAVFTLGFLLLAVSLIAFHLIGMVYIYILFGLAVLGLGAFFIMERRVEQPMLDFRLFEDKLFACASLDSALNGTAMGAVLFVLIFFFQGPYGLDPLLAGILMAPFGLAFRIVGPI